MMNNASLPQSWAVCLMLAAIVVLPARADHIEMRIDLKGGFPAQAVLVRATVIGVEDDRENVNATFRIDHVYYGSNIKVDDRLTIHSPKRVPDRGNEMPLFPSPTIGESGIWLFSREADGSVTTRPTTLYQQVLPARDPKHPSFKAASQFAATVEKVSLAEVDSRISMARELAQSPAPELATYGISLLANSGVSDDVAARYLEELSEKSSLSCAARVAIDEALIKVKRRGWGISTNRVALLHGCVADKEPDIGRIYGRLHTIAQNSKEGGIDQGQMIALLQAGLTNPEVPPQSRWRLVSIARYFPLQYADASATFEWLANLVGESDDGGIRIAAANALHAFSLDAKRRAIIRKLLDGASEDQVKRLLTQALADQE